MRRVSTALILLILAGGGSATAFEFLGLTLFEDQNEIDAEAVIADSLPYSATLITAAEADLEARIRDASRLLGADDEPANGAAGLLATAQSCAACVLDAGACTVSLLLLCRAPVDLTPVGDVAGVCERSEFPRRPSTDRGAQGTGVRSTTARGPAARFFWLLFFSREKKSDTHEQ